MRVGTCGRSRLASAHAPFPHSACTLAYHAPPVCISRHSIQPRPALASPPSCCCRGEGTRPGACVAHRLCCSLLILLFLSADKGPPAKASLRGGGANSASRFACCTQSSWLIIRSGFPVIGGGGEGRGWVRHARQRRWHQGGEWGKQDMGRHGICRRAALHRP